MHVEAVILHMFQMITSITFITVRCSKWWLWKTEKTHEGAEKDKVTEKLSEALPHSSG